MTLRINMYKPTDLLYSTFENNSASCFFRYFKHIFSFATPSALPLSLAPGLCLSTIFQRPDPEKKTYFKSILDLLTLLGQQTCSIIFPSVCFQTFQPIHLQGIMSCFVGLSKTHKITSLTCLFPSTCATARNPTQVLSAYNMLLVCDESEAVKFSKKTGATWSHGNSKSTINLWQRACKTLVFQISAEKIFWVGFSDLLTRCLEA